MIANEATIQQESCFQWPQQATIVLAYARDNVLRGEPTANVQNRHDEVRLAEELVPCPADDRSQAEDEKEGDETLRNDAPDHVLLFNPVHINLRLRLVQETFNDSPDDTVNERLNQNDSARPAVQKVEALIGYTSEHTQY